PAERDQHAAPGSLGRAACRAIRGERLGRRAEVELDARGDADHPVARVDLDPAPARGRLEPCAKALAVPRPDADERAVVAGEPKGPADGRVDQASRDLGRAEGDLNRLEQALADLDDLARAWIEPDELRVAPEAAA